MQQLFPALTISPASIELGSNITWLPGLSFTNNTSSKTPLADPGAGAARRPAGYHPQTAAAASPPFNFDTPLRFGSFNWQNSLQVTDEMNTGRDSTVLSRIESDHADPNDSLTVTGSSAGTSPPASTGTPASTSRCSSAARGSCSRVGIANATSGRLRVRNRNTGGCFVRAGEAVPFLGDGVTDTLRVLPRLRLAEPASGTASRRSAGISCRRRPCPSITRGRSPAGQRAAAQERRHSDGERRPLQAFEAKAKPAKGDTSHRRAKVPGAEHQYEPDLL